MTTGATSPIVHPPAPVNWTDLIATGRAALIPPPPAAQPTPAAIRRAISTAYYAAFHALTASNADALIGSVRNQLTADAWMRIYRGLNHNHAKSQLQRNRTGFSADARVFADLFSDLRSSKRAP